MISRQNQIMNYDTYYGPYGSGGKYLYVQDVMKQSGDITNATFAAFDAITWWNGIGTETVIARQALARMGLSADELALAGMYPGSIVRLAKWQQLQERAAEADRIQAAVEDIARGEAAATMAAHQGSLGAGTILSQRSHPNINMLLGADEVSNVFQRPIRLSYYGEELSAYSWLYRNETGMLGDMNYNVAVFEVKGEIPAGFFPQPAQWGDIRVYDGNIFVFSNIPDAMHSEAVGYTVLTEGGINTLSQVRALYTEFEPCAELCIPLLQNGFEFSPSLRITYSFPYNYPERELGRIIKEDTFRRFFGQ